MKIPAGSGINVGRIDRKHRLEPELAQSIAKLSASLPDVQEAYLFECFANGISKPAEVLALVFSTSSDFTEAVATTIGRALPTVLPPGTHLDVWQLPPDHSMLGSVRLLGRKLFVRSPTGEPIFAELPPEEKKSGGRFGSSIHQMSYPPQAFGRAGFAVGCPKPRLRSAGCHATVWAQVI